MTIAERARRVGMNEGTLRSRLCAGLTLKEALGRPVRPRGVKHCGWCGATAHTLRVCQDAKRGRL